MVRIIDEDFDLLKKFLREYSLTHIEQSPSQLAVLKSAHKNYLPLLQLWSIFSDKISGEGLTFFSKGVQLNCLEYIHFREAISDVGSGLFCCIHGAYKPGYMALRSSIENYLRFSSGLFDGAALGNKSVYDLFDIAKSTTPFHGDRSLYLNRLRNSYVELCKYTHSASLSHMSAIHALEHFPTFDEPSFKEWLGFAKICISSMATITILGCPSIYSDSHFIAQELLEIVTSQEARILILKGC